MRSAPQFTPSVFGAGPAFTLHTVPIPNLQPSDLNAFNVFHFSHLPPLDFSLRSFFTRRPLFSITSRLFSQNTRGGGTSTNLHLRISNIQTLFPRPACKAVNSHAIPARNPLSVYSVPLWQIQFSFALCFHILTNCFPRKPFSFTTIRIARGCGGSSSFPSWFACAQASRGPRMIAYETC
jgi:hypothetical protein